jgi:hypothetical protein
MTMRSHFHLSNLLGSGDKRNSHHYRTIAARQIGNQDVHRSGERGYCWQVARRVQPTQRVGETSRECKLHHQQLGNVKGMAVVSLTNSAKTEEQIKELVKVIIIATNDQETQQDNSYQMLLKIASLNSEKEAKINKALEDKDIVNLLQLFPPFPITTQLAQIPPEKESEGEEVNLKTKTQQLINQQANQVKNLVSNIYSTDKSQRQSAVSELSQEKYRSYDEIMVGEMLNKFKQNSNNYFGIVNTLFLLSKVDISYLQSNQEKINQLVNSADSILNASNKTQYLIPIKNRLETLSK